MQRKTIGLLAGSVLALCSTAFMVAAIPADGDTMPVPAAADANGSHAPAAIHRGAAIRERNPNIDPGVRAGVRDLRAIDRLYYASGRAKDLPGLYQDMLTKAQNPQLRNYLSFRLARLQSAPANTDAAIATLRRSLDENLARANSTSVPRGG